MNFIRRAATFHGVHPANTRPGSTTRRRFLTRNTTSHQIGHIAARRVRAALFEIDQKIIRHAWDAELILREHNAPRYALFPAQPGDAAIVAAAGGTLTNEFRAAVTIFCCSPDE